MALFNKTFLLAVGCCFEDFNNTGQCLCTGTEIDDPATPGSCCMDDVDDPGNCCKFAKYKLREFSIT